MLAAQLLVIAAMAVWQPPDAQAGKVVFFSDRCESAADHERRGYDFTPAKQCKPAIWTVRDDGSGLTRLTEGGLTGGIGDLTPAWSPDGSRIAFASGQGSHLPRIWVMDADGSNRRRLTSDSSNPDQADVSPAWSPDGRQIVFESNRPPTEGLGPDLWIMDADGGNLRQLTSTTQEELSPSFSPDGLRVLFSRVTPGFATDAPARDTDGLFTVSLLGTGERRLTSGLPVAFGAAFSPEGTRIAFSLFGNLWTMAADGHGLQRRTFAPRVQDFVGDSGVTWAGPLRLIYSSSPRTSPTDTRSVLYGLDLLDDAPPGALTAGWESESVAPLMDDSKPDWHPGLPELPIPVSDELPPALALLDGASQKVVPHIGRAGAAMAFRPKASASALRLVAVDELGIRTVQASIARRVGRRCRYLGERRFGRLRSCRRSVFRPAGSHSLWRRMVRRLPPGSYTVRLRATDVRGNRTDKPRAFRIRLRR